MESRSSPSTRRPARRKDPGQRRGEALQELRRLILGPEQMRIESLEGRPLPSADTVAEVLPEALARSTEQRGQELEIAMEPVLTSALRTLVKQDASYFGEVLAPTIGAAVRTAVKEAIAIMLQRFNEALERSVSLESMKWRIEARRSGRPFAEVMLLRTLVYRVEHVFLIHPYSGIVLQHCSSEGCSVHAPDQVASMLEAMDSFVREALQPASAGLHLSHVEAGDLTVWVDRDTSLAIAAVVRGVAPRELGELLREVRERIYLAHQAELARFQSDVSPFLAARPILERCLHERRRTPARRAHIWLAVAAALLVLVAGGLIAHRSVRAARQGRMLRSYVAALQQEPGIVVTSAQRERGRFHLAGFRDPLATAPHDVLGRQGLPVPELRFEPFFSLDPRLIERRARLAIAPPSTVTLTMQDGTLRAAGMAPRGWVERTRWLAAALPGIVGYDDQGLRPSEAVEKLDKAASALDSVAIPFPLGSSTITARAAVAQARSLWQQVKDAAHEARVPVCVTVIGHADATGTEEGNKELSHRRAERVLEQLDADAGRLRAIGAGVWDGNGGAAGARSTTFRVEVASSCSEAP